MKKIVKSKVKKLKILPVDLNPTQKKKVSFNSIIITKRVSMNEKNNVRKENSERKQEIIIISDYFLFFISFSSLVIFFLLCFCFALELAVFFVNFQYLFNSHRVQKRKCCSSSNFNFLFC